MSAKAIMVQGTMSNAGKSLLCTALCRIFKQDGYRVAPFKSQNMALNSYITAEGLEMGRAQVAQAQAAGVEPSVLMNPILLKPSSDVGSQVIVNGEVRGNMRATEYFRYKTQLIPDILRAYESLAAQNDILVLEGAGSPAEINLKQNDIVNMGMAKMAHAPVLLVGDIDLGGVFAQLYGTVALLDPGERALIKATVINKFRGDVSLLQSGLQMLEDLIQIPCAGVIPYTQVDIDDEDSQSPVFAARQRREADIAVIRLPRISNFTDFSVFSQFPTVSVRYVQNPAQLGEPDLIFLPGTKSTLSDLKWLRESGLETQILRAAGRGVPVFGICGGLQMLGQRIDDPMGVEGGGSTRGLGLLPICTVFSANKTRAQVSGVFSGLTGLFSELNGLSYTGYEIHMGRSDGETPVLQCESVYGSYIHGLFDSADIARRIVTALLRQKGLSIDPGTPPDRQSYRESQYDKLAATVRKALNMDLIYRIVEKGV